MALAQVRGGARPNTRAAIFAVLLIVLGLGAVYIRLAHPDLHPQLLLALYSIPANSAISVFSHEVALLDYGSHQPILLSTLSATIGTVAAGYLDWHIFVPLFSWSRISGYRRNRVYRYCIDKFSRAPFLVLVITGFTPIPFFPFKFLAFSMRYPLWKYLAAVIVARAPRYLLLAWLGSNVDIPAWVLIAGFVALFVPTAWQLVRGRGAIPADRREP